MSNAEHAAVTWAIERQIRLFAFLNDAHDHDGVADLFTADGRFARPTDPDNVIAGRENIRTFFRDRPQRATLHFMANTVVDIECADRASARSYILLLVGGGAIGGQFHDRLSKEEGRWLFAERCGSVLPSVSVKAAV